MIEITEHHPKCHLQDEFRNPMECPCAHWAQKFTRSAPTKVEEVSELQSQPSDGTTGHSKGNWRISGEMTIDGYDNICSIARGTLQSVSSANQRLITLAQSAPHDCGDPECPGLINKRKLELYDKFQRAIHEFANAGLLT